jgi:hypothetical protein
MSIIEGDLVIVGFMSAKVTLSEQAEVLHVPRGRGDGWIFRDMKSGAIHYVSEPCTISKIVNANKLK